jgi:hypothetical protein
MLWFRYRLERLAEESRRLVVYADRFSGQRDGQVERFGGIGRQEAVSLRFGSQAVHVAAEKLREGRRTVQSQHLIQCIEGGPGIVTGDDAAVFQRIPDQRAVGQRVIRRVGVLPKQGPVQRDA